jgi:hypothetical protein
VVGKPRRQPKRLHADRRYDHDKYRHHPLVGMTVRRMAGHAGHLERLAGRQPCSTGQLKH